MYNINLLITYDIKKLGVMINMIIKNTLRTNANKPEVIK